MEVGKPKKKNNFQDDKYRAVGDELQVIRKAVEENQRKQEELKNENMDKKLIQNIRFHVYEFLKKNKLIMYGGAAINNVLPKHVQFYNDDIDIPDYDAYSVKPLVDVKKLADYLLANGIENVYAKSGLHYNSFKVMIDIIPIMDITYLPPLIYKNIKKDAIHINGVLYCPIDFLRMNIHNELSKPLGHTARWEKVYSRLTLLNQFYPRPTEESRPASPPAPVPAPVPAHEDTTFEDRVSIMVKDALTNIGAVFIGEYACHIYAKTFKKVNNSYAEKFQSMPECFEALYQNSQMGAQMVQEKLMDQGIRKVRVIKHNELAEFIPVHFEIRINNKPYTYIYEPMGCNSFNSFTSQNIQISVASIHTMFYYTYSFKYSKVPYHNVKTYDDMIGFLYELDEKTELKATGLLKRFPLNCVGNQEFYEDILKKKNMKFKELKNRKNDKEYEILFLNYNPSMPPKPVQAETTKPFYYRNTRKNRRGKYGRHTHLQPFENWPDKIRDKLTRKKPHVNRKKHIFRLWDDR